MSEEFDRDDEVKARVWDPALFRRLLVYALPYWRRLLLGSVLVTLLSFLSVLPPLLSGALVDEVFGTGDGLPARAVASVVSALTPGLTPAEFSTLPAPTRLWIFAAVFLFVRTAAFFLDWGNGYLLMGMGQRIIYDIRMRVFGHIHGLDLAWFHKNPVGRLVTRTTNDVGALEEMFSVALVTLIKDVGMLVGIALWLLVIDAELGLITMTVIPFMIVATLIFRRASRGAYRRWRAALSRLNAFLSESIGGIRVVQLFHREEENGRRYDAIGEDYRRHFMSQRRAWAIFRPVNTTLSAAGIGLVFAFGGAAAAETVASPAATGITIGVLVSFLGYVELFFVPIRDMTEKFDILQGAMTAAERIFSVLDEESRIRVAKDAVDPGRVRGAVEFRGVAFEYVSGEPVIRDLSFEIPPGETAAIVGHTGAGKTTIINLLSRFYDVGSGSVRVDGRDVRDLDLQGLRKNLAVVHQDVFLFAGTITENLRLGDDTISEDRVREACRQVAADRFIERLPGAYDAIVEEGGKTFSAGERQLLSFARALVFDPAILVLDEATASVDSKTEELVQAALRTITRDRTSIVIAHRLSTIKRADRILVLEHGRLVETGHHEELLARGGLYRRLYEMQFAD